MSSESFSFFFFNDTATTEIYTLSLHDALPISAILDAPPTRIVVTQCSHLSAGRAPGPTVAFDDGLLPIDRNWRSEEHTSELQSRLHLVCRLLLEKKTPSFTRRMLRASSHTLCI